MEQDLATAGPFERVAHPLHRGIEEILVRFRRHHETPIVSDIVVDPQAGVVQIATPKLLQADVDQMGRDPVHEIAYELGVLLDIHQELLDAPQVHRTKVGAAGFAEHTVLLPPALDVLQESLVAEVLVRRLEDQAVQFALVLDRYFQFFEELRARPSADDTAPTVPGDGIPVLLADVHRVAWPWGLVRDRDSDLDSVVLFRRGVLCQPQILTPLRREFSPEAIEHRDAIRPLVVQGGHHPLFRVHSTPPALHKADGSIPNIEYSISDSDV